MSTGHLLPDPKWKASRHLLPLITSGLCAGPESFHDVPEVTQVVDSRTRTAIQERKTLKR